MLVETPWFKVGLVVIYHFSYSCSIQSCEQLDCYIFNISFLCVVCVKRVKENNFFSRKKTAKIWTFQFNTN